jgi:hypothetical protein
LNGYLLVKDTATFTFSGVSGFTEADIKTSCVFGEGTKPDGFLAGTVPEAGTLTLLITAGLGLLAYAWRRRS